MFRRGETSTCHVCHPAQGCINSRPSCGSLAKPVAGRTVTGRAIPNQTVTHFAVIKRCRTQHQIRLMAIQAAQPPMAVRIRSVWGSRAAALGKIGQGGVIWQYLLLGQALLEEGLASSLIADGDMACSGRHRDPRAGSVPGDLYAAGRPAFSSRRVSIPDPVGGARVGSGHGAESRSRVCPLPAPSPAPSHPCSRSLAPCPAPPSSAAPEWGQPAQSSRSRAIPARKLPCHSWGLKAFSG